MDFVRTEKTVGTNFGKCPVCSNPLVQTHIDYLEGFCAERELKCNFCLSYEYEYSYGNTREIIAWCKWEYVGLFATLEDRKTLREQQIEFVNTFKQYFKRWQEMKEFPPMFADWLQEELYQGNTNEMLDLIRLQGFVLVSGDDRLSLPTGLI